MKPAISRRFVLLAIACGSLPGQDLPAVQHFPKVKWIPWPAGAPAPLAFGGTLVVNRRSEKLTFFEEYTSTQKWQTELGWIRGLRYEQASKPTGHPAEGKAADKFFGKKQRHFLTLAWEAEGTLRLEYFELDKKWFGAVLQGLQQATGKSIEGWEPRADD